MAKANHTWKRNTLSIENEGRKYVIDLRKQEVSEELTSSDSEFEGGKLGMDEGRKDIGAMTKGCLKWKIALKMRRVL